MTVGWRKRWLLYRGFACESQSITFLFTDLCHFSSDFVRSEFLWKEKTRREENWISENWEGCQTKFWTIFLCLCVWDLVFQTGNGRVIGCDWKCPDSREIDNYCPSLIDQYHIQYGSLQNSVFTVSLCSLWLLTQAPRCYLCLVYPLWLKECCSLFCVCVADTCCAMVCSRSVGTAALT